MTTPGSDGYSQGCTIELHPSIGESGPRLDNYFLKSTQELEAIAEIVSQGKVVDRVSRDWMLAQVDFIVETIGSERMELGDEQRSNLLQLLLSIANLNEQIRRQTSLSL
jgi:hypothetical protein